MAVTQTIYANERRLTPEERARALEIALSAEPFDYDSPEYNTLDGDADPARLAATFAKEMLERYG
ncbi:hypothetical protein FACS1894217_11070 [Clostridia bacterium]|nr:hypothetical protein FACS1894217_11070 [Clostridia bacterium]